MSIVVVGGGAIGLLVAGQLKKSFQQVAILARSHVAQALRSNHLALAHRGEVKKVEGLVVATDPAEFPLTFQKPDLAILSVKAYDTANALPTLASLQPAKILTIQNGIGNEEILAARFGPERVLSGAITSSVEYEHPAIVSMRKSGAICLAPVIPSAKIDHWVEIFRAAGFHMAQYNDYRALKWSKALLNMLGNATSAILDMSVEEVYANVRLVALEQRAFLEGRSVMARLEIEPVNIPGYPTRWLSMLMSGLPFPLLHMLLKRAIAGGRGGKAPSLHIDIQRGRNRTEGEYLYGAIARTAYHSNLSTPVNAVLWYVLEGITSGALDKAWFYRQPERLLAMVGIERSRSFLNKR